MAYIIDARLDRGTPSLTLIDAVTGEERLHWRCESMASGERSWENLFKRLVLLSLVHWRCLQFLLTAIAKPLFS